LEPRFIFSEMFFDVKNPMKVGVAAKVATQLIASVIGW